MFETEAQVIPDIFFETSGMPSAAKPTLLYSLEPRGIGTVSCESLKSYLFRLADAHRVSPSLLVSGAIWKLLVGRMLYVYRGFERMVYRLNWLAIPGGKTAAMVSALSTATGLNNLDHLTLAPISHVLISNGLVAKKERYCPLCIEYDAHGWRAHGRLVWAMASVTACPMHRIKLIDRKCDAPIEKKVHFFKRKRMFGVCEICGSIGLRCRKGVIEQASEQEIWRSEQVGILVENLPQAKTIFSPQKTIQGIKRLIDLYSSGNSVAAARSAGIHKTILCELTRGVYLPNIEKMLNLCQVNSVSLVSVLKGAPENIPSPKIGIFPPPKNSRANKPNLSEREHLLKEALKHNPPRSFRAICKNMGLIQKTVTIQFPALSAKIVNRYADYLKTCRQEKRRLLLEEAEMTLQDMSEKSIRLTMRNIREFSGKVLFPQSNLRRAFDEVLSRHQGHSLPSLPS